MSRNTFTEIPKVVFDQICGHCGPPKVDTEDPYCGLYLFAPDILSTQEGLS